MAPYEEMTQTKKDKGLKKLIKRSGKFLYKLKWTQTSLEEIKQIRLEINDLVQDKNCCLQKTWKLIKVCEDSGIETKKKIAENKITKIRYLQTEN